MKRLYLMITITNRVMGSKRFVDFLPGLRRTGGVYGAGPGDRQR